MTPIVEIKDLVKQYNGHPAVDHLDLTVNQGDIFGFVGPNGAGKTTTIRIMATLLAANQGDICIAGHSVHQAPNQVRQIIGYMPDFFGVYPDMLVWEYLDFFGACYKILPPQRTALLRDLLELVDLTHRKDDPVEGLSRGMKQRLSLARTLIHDPQLLILDEPASGLDPRARVEIRELMVELARMGKTIFFSTHILADVAEICTRVGIIEAGKLVASGTLEELQQHAVPHRQIHITLLDKAESAQAFLTSFPGVSGIVPMPGNQHAGRIRLEIEFVGDDDALSALLDGLIQNNLPVLHFSEDSRDMEEIFMRTTKGLVT
jgi:ABC-2 type transport system ATP-binding protein